jgi:RimJ/RimL family protein N-acetyltransferase
LALLTEADLPLTLAWRNDLRTAFFNADLLDAARHRLWFERYRELDSDFVFIITDREQLHCAVGQASLYDIDWDAGTAEYGRLMLGHPLAKGRGLATEATRLLVEKATALGLRDLRVHIRTTNLASIAVCRRCGWQDVADRDGVLEMRRLAPAPGDAAMPPALDRAER